MKSETTASGRNNLKKDYIKPTLELIELRSEERIAGNSNINCGVCQKEDDGCGIAGTHGGSPHN